MDNQEGLIRTAAAVNPTEEDTSLPDPTLFARIFLGACIVLAFVVAVVANSKGWTTKAFKPSEQEAANFALFAGFYVGAQLIERLMELISPLLPFWGLPNGFPDDGKARVAQYKADRAKATMGLAALFGVCLSAGFGLYFLEAVGIDVPRMPDIFFTGLLIAAGTKPLHDFITGLQNKGSSKSGTSA